MDTVAALVAHRRRVPSIDEGSPEWPTASDMCEDYTFPDDSIEGLNRTVEEVHAVTGPLAEMESDTRRSSSLPRGGAARLRLPEASDTRVASYPEAFQNHIRECAAAVIVSCLLPQIRRRRYRLARQRYLLQRTSSSPPAFPIECIRNLEIFRSWPPEALKRIAQTAKSKVFFPGDVIVFRGEPASGALILSSGCCAVASRGVTNKTLMQCYASVRAKVPDKPAYLPVGPLVPEGTTYFNATQLFGETNMVMDETWTSNMVAITHCEVFVLLKKDFALELSTLPQSVVELTHRAVVLRRNADLHVRCPFAARNIREHGVLAVASIAFAEQLALRIEPACCRCGTALTTEGAPSLGLYFLRRGRVQILKKNADGVNVHVAYRLGPCVLGDAAVVDNAPSYDVTTLAVTDVDAYFVAKAAFIAAQKAHPSDAEKMALALAEKKRDDLRRNLSHHRDIIDRVPLLRDLPLSPSDITDFLSLLEPKTYRPLTSIGSVSTYCNRIIIITKGKIRAGEHEIVKAGDCIGWTCVIPQRWGETLMTLNDNAEVLEAACSKYMSFLDKRGWLQRITQETKAILFPRAHRLNVVNRIRERLPPHVVTYPVSSQTVVNLNELRFCSVHMEALAEQQKRDADEHARRELMTPPPFKPLSSGLWAPKAHVGRISGFVVKRK